MVEETLEEIPFVCRAIGDDKEKISAWNKNFSGPLQWKKKVYSEVWHPATDADLLGSHNEVQYAKSAQDLKDLLETMNNTPPGLEAYDIGTAWGWKQPPRVYRFRHYLVTDYLDALEVLDSVRKYKKLHITSELAHKLYRNTDTVPDLEHVHPISEDVLIKPRMAVGAPLLLELNVKQAKTMGSRRRNEQVQTRTVIALDKLRTRRAAEKIKREKERYQLARHRFELLSSVYAVLTGWLLRGLRHDSTILRASELHRAYSYQLEDRAALEHVLDVLGVYAGLGLDPVEAFNWKKWPGKATPLKVRPTKGNKQDAAAFIRSFEKYFECYKDPFGLVTTLWSGSGWVSDVEKEFHKDGPVDVVSGKHDEYFTDIEVGRLEKLKSAYVALKALVEALRAARGMETAQPIKGKPIRGPEAPNKADEKLEEEYITSGNFLKEIEDIEPSKAAS